MTKETLSDGMTIKLGLIGNRLVSLEWAYGFKEGLEQAKRINHLYNIPDKSKLTKSLLEKIKSVQTAIEKDKKLK